MSKKARTKGDFLKACENCRKCANAMRCWKSFISSFNFLQKILFKCISLSFLPKICTNEMCIKFICTWNKHVQKQTRSCCTCTDLFSKEACNKRVGAYGHIILKYVASGCGFARGDKVTSEEHVIYKHRLLVTRFCWRPMWSHGGFPSQLPPLVPFQNEMFRICWATWIAWQRFPVDKNRWEGLPCFQCISIKRSVHWLIVAQYL